MTQAPPEKHSARSCRPEHADGVRSCFATFPVVPEFLAGPGDAHTVTRLSSPTMWQNKT
jgi:hypothetical protein